ncbi:hypothetical protein AK830_g559 [Neonectria ditissima]|uniref:Eukaryotic translation initiation factor 6 n=1 Tax=Neonectria ditissima TaxID=78410 RepID=A0A0P7B7D1_9HYPO|nr:hypothetical protein AK830_g559 [Neonectria ditissima]
MSSRSGSNSHRRHSREPLEDFPPLPVPRLPSLRALAAQRERDNTSPTLSSRPQSRPQSRHWSASASAVSRRAERIRNIENRDPSFDDDFFRPSDEGWPTMSRRADRMRSSVENLRPANFEDLDRSLEEANSHIRLLVDLQNQLTPEYPIHVPSFSPPLRPQDPPDSNRRHKRRKLDSDRLVPSFKGFRYGKYGQVEPGPLQMEIVSCDGGMFSNESSYAAENILKNDTSVYCTKGNRCNIVLRHQGATVFTLQELVIKAPASMNYSHPVREGMVFVTMNQDDTLSRTAQYQIQYPPRSHDDICSEENPRHERPIISIQHHVNGTTTTHTRPFRIGCADNYEPRTPEMPHEFTSSLPDCRVTIECSEDEDEDDGQMRFIRRAPNHIGSLPFETPDSDSDEGNPFGSEYLDDPNHPPHWRLYGGTSNTGGGSAANLRRLRDRDRDRIRDQDHDRSRSSFSLTDAWEAHASATQDAVRAVGGGDLLTPYARFYIEKKKSKCTIRFDPPVSGRFILLKMWSSHHDPTSNIDIQSIIARGFAGPRYFPSVDLR